MYAQLLILSLVAQLGDDDFYARESAQEQLVAASPYSNQAIKHARSSLDPEISRRARSSLKMCRGMETEKELYVEAKEMILYFDHPYGVRHHPLSDKEKQRVIEGGRKFHEELVQVARNYQLLPESEKSPLDDPEYLPDHYGGVDMCNFVDMMRHRTLLAKGE